MYRCSLTHIHKLNTTHKTCIEEKANKNKEKECCAHTTFSSTWMNVWMNVSAKEEWTPTKGTNKVIVVLGLNQSRVFRHIHTVAHCVYFAQPFRIFVRNCNQRGRNMSRLFVQLFCFAIYKKKFFYWFFLIFFLMLFFALSFFLRFCWKRAKIDEHLIVENVFSFNSNRYKNNRR